MEVSTVSGDLEARNLTGRLSYKSVSGDLTVRLDAGVPAQYTVNTVAGSLQLDDTRVTGIKGQYSSRYGELAGAFTEVVASSVSGDVSVVHTERESVA